MPDQGSPSGGRGLVTITPSLLEPTFYYALYLSSYNCPQPLGLTPNIL